MPSNPQSEIRNPKSTDPDNRLLWHYPRRRLTAEQLRDSLLAVTGRLNAQFGGESIMPPVKQELIDLLYDPAQWQVTPDQREHDRRSIYLVAKRNLQLPFMEVFDQPDLQIELCPRRIPARTPPQSLELLNGELSNDLAAAFRSPARSRGRRRSDASRSSGPTGSPRAGRRAIASENWRSNSCANSR